jgi:hypothetical protein
MVAAMMVVVAVTMVVVAIVMIVAVAMVVGMECVGMVVVVNSCEVIIRSRWDLLGVVRVSQIAVGFGGKGVENQKCGHLGRK